MPSCWFDGNATTAGVGRGRGFADGAPFAAGVGRGRGLAAGALLDAATLAGASFPGALFAGILLAALSVGRSGRGAVRSSIELIGTTARAVSADVVFLAGTGGANCAGVATRATAADSLADAAGLLAAEGLGTTSAFTEGGLFEASDGGFFAAEGFFAGAGFAAAGDLLVARGVFGEAGVDAAAGLADGFGTEALLSAGTAVFPADTAVFPAAFPTTVLPADAAGTGRAGRAVCTDPCSAAGRFFGSGTGVGAPEGRDVFIARLRSRRARVRRRRHERASPARLPFGQEGPDGIAEYARTTGD